MIDFQDAVIGPITYDLVSLLKDCYLHLPADQVEQRALDYKRTLEADKQLKNMTDQEFLRSFDKMGLQRHIKVLGIFARLCLRDGKSGYLNDLPLVIRYTLEAAQRYRKRRLSTTGLSNVSNHCCPATNGTASGEQPQKPAAKKILLETSRYESDDFSRWARRALATPD